MDRRVIAAATLGLLAVSLAPVAAVAEQIAGLPGSPSATTTIDGKQLPHTPFKFGGTIERYGAQSKPYWPPRVEPATGGRQV
jgi:arylsulfatase